MAESQDFRNFRDRLTLASKKTAEKYTKNHRNTTQNLQTEVIKMAEVEKNIALLFSLVALQILQVFKSVEGQAN